MNVDSWARQLAGNAKTNAAIAVKHTRRQCMNKCGALGGASSTALSTTPETGKTFRVTVFTPLGSGASNPSFVFSNWNVLGTGEADGIQDIVVKAYFEYNGVSYPITFRGAKSVTISPGCQVESDPLGLLIPANTQCYVRTYVSCAAAGQWPVGRLPHTGSGEGGNAAAGTTGADAASGTGALAGNSNVYMYGPIAIIGEQTTPTAVVGFPGDSIGVGTNDTVQTNGYFGYIERALGNKLPWLSNTRSSTKLNDFNTSHVRRMAFFPQLITSVIVELIRNDIASDAVALSVAQSRAIAGWSEFSTRGIYVWGITCTPTTTSSDAWATLVNQTVTATETVRTQYNDWLRDGAPMSAGVAVATGTVGALRMGASGHPLTGFFDVADQCESARNSGKWRVDLGTPTTDGVHPAAVVHAQIATIINTSVFL